MTIVGSPPSLISIATGFGTMHGTREEILRQFAAEYRKRLESDTTVPTVSMKDFLPVLIAHPPSPRPYLSWSPGFFLQDGQMCRHRFTHGDASHLVVSGSPLSGKAELIASMVLQVVANNYLAGVDVMVVSAADELNRLGTLPGVEVRKPDLRLSQDLAHFGRMAGADHLELLRPQLVVLDNYSRLVRCCPSIEAAVKAIMAPRKHSSGIHLAVVVEDRLEIPVDYPTVLRAGTLGGQNVAVVERRSKGRPGSVVLTWEEANTADVFGV